MHPGRADVSAAAEKPLQSRRAFAEPSRYSSSSPFAAGADCSGSGPADRDALSAARLAFLSATRSAFLATARSVQRLTNLWLALWDKPRSAAFSSHRPCAFNCADVGSAAPSPVVPASKINTAPNGAMPRRLMCSHRRIILLFHRGCVEEAAAGWHGRPPLAPFRTRASPSVPRSLRMSPPVRRCWEGLVADPDQAPPPARLRMLARMVERLGASSGGPGTGDAHEVPDRRPAQADCAGAGGVSPTMRFQSDRKLAARKMVSERECCFPVRPSPR